MIKITGVEYKANGVMILSKRKIESFVHRQLLDYKENYFDTPHPINIDDFVENYLHINMEFHQLSLDGSELGATALSDGKIPIVDSDGKVSIRIFKKGSICIDEKACNSETRTSFTIGHEAGHSQFNMKADKSLLNNKDQVKDKLVQIGSQYIKMKTKTDEDWMEWQADTYSAFLHMPREFVTELYHQKHDEYFKNKRITTAHPQRLWKIIIEISDFLCVSREAMAIRLKELKLISRDQFKSLEINNFRKGGNKYML